MSVLTSTHNHIPLNLGVQIIAILDIGMSNLDMRTSLPLGRLTHPQSTYKYQGRGMNIFAHKDTSHPSNIKS